MQPHDKKSQNLDIIRNESNRPTSGIVAEIVKIAIPAMLCQFAAFFQRSTNVVIIGYLGDDKKLAGVGLGNAEIENFGMCVWMGLIGGLQT